MTDRVRWGVACTGAIARAFVATMREVRGAEIAAVASDRLERAERFGAEHGIAAAVAPHEALAGVGVDAVYVAATNDRHRAIAVACLDACVPVLLEKPVALNAEQAGEIVAAARRSGTFLMEAWWTRFLPWFDTVTGLIDAGEIGDARWVQADFGFPVDSPPDRRLWSLEQGGGALLDIGIYPLTLAHLLLGAPAETRAVGVRAATGVDAQVAVVSTHSEGTVSVLSASFAADTSIEATVAGPRGRLRIEAPFHHSVRTTLHRAGEQVAAYDTPYRGHGYAYEVEEVHRCLRAGLSESPLRPHADTLAVMRWMDEVRRQIGVRYPGD
jgi:predicted dehydrogenase